MEYSIRQLCDIDKMCSPTIGPASTGAVFVPRMECAPAHVQLRTFINNVYVCVVCACTRAHGGSDD
jgi:hypothetical protein